MSYSALDPEIIKELKESKGTELGGVAKAPARWQKGVSGNPAGRPKGAKNKETLVKQAVRAQAEGILLENAEKVVKTVIEQAINGCRTSQKLVWSSLIAARRSEDGAESAPPQVQIVIEGLPDAGVTINADD